MDNGGGESEGVKNDVRLVAGCGEERRENAWRREKRKEKVRNQL